MLTFHLAVCEIGAITNPSNCAIHPSLNDRVHAVARLGSDTVEPFILPNDLVRLLSNQLASKLPQVLHVASTVLSISYMPYKCLSSVCRASGNQTVDLNPFEIMPIA